jgi:hypothetical protein
VEFLVLLFYVILACIFWYPLAFYFRTAQLEPNAVDPAFNQWILGWGNHALTHYPWRYFEANMYYPYHHTLAWGDHLFSLVLMSLPLIPLFGVLGAYNLILIGSTALAGFSMYLLAKYITKQQAAAIIAGVMWGYMTSRIDERGHIQVQVIQWIPLVFLFAEKIRFEFSRKNFILFVIFSFLALATNFYLTMYTVIGFGVYVVFLFISGGLNIKSLGRIVLGFGLAALLALPLYIISILIQLHDPVIRDNASQVSMAISGLLPWPWPGHLLRSFLAEHGHAVTQPPTNHSLGLLTYFFFLFGVIRLWLERGKWRENRRMIVFLIVAFVMFAMAIGPHGYWFDKTIIHYNVFFDFPYNHIPGYEAIRMPMRAHTVGALGVMLFAVWGLAFMIKRIPTKWQYAVVVLCAAWIIIEQSPAPLKLYPTYDYSKAEAYHWLQSQPGEFPIVEYPLFPGSGGGHKNDLIEAKRMYFSTYHWKRRVTGSISPYRPDSYGWDAELIDGLGENPEAIEWLQTNKVKYVLLIPDDFVTLGIDAVAAKHKTDFIDHAPGLKKVGVFSDATIYEVE